MRRRDLMLLLSGLLTVPRALGAQQKPMPVIGILAAAASDNVGALKNLVAFRQGLGEFGYVEGQNVAIEYRWADAQFDRLPALAADLVGRKVDVIVTEDGESPTIAAKRATSTIPIVFHTSNDPVATGLVASLARPGGNLTGISVQEELTAKRLELLSELVPQAKAIALLVNPHDSTADGFIRSAQEAGRARGFHLEVVRAGNESEIDAAFATLVQLRAGGLNVTGNVLFSRQRDRIVALASRHAVPAVYQSRFWAEAGGLLSYGPNFSEVYRLKGVYAGKILKGAKPADLPVEQPHKLELLINLKTATALGLTVPQSLFARADEVIE